MSLLGSVVELLRIPERIQSRIMRWRYLTPPFSLCFICVEFLTVPLHHNRAVTLAEKQKAVKFAYPHEVRFTFPIYL